jgi:branched-chain amino acid transport system permease protein
MLVLQALLDGLSIGASFALLAAGVAIISSVLRFVSFSFGGQVVLVAFIITALSQVLPLWLALIAGVGAGIAISLVTIPIAFSRAATMPPSTLVMLSFALGLAFQSVLVMAFGDSPRPFPAPEWAAQTLTLGAGRISIISLVTIAVAVIVLSAMGLVLNKTRIGVGIRGAAEDPEVAQMLGVKPRIIVAAAFAISGAISAVVAYLWFAKAGSVTPRVGLDLSLSAFIAVVVGGVTSLRGSVIGGVLLGLATSLLTTLLPGDITGYARVFLFVLVVVLLLVRPQGLLGSKWKESR